MPIYLSDLNFFCYINTAKIVDAINKVLSCYVYSCIYKVSLRYTHAENDVNIVFTNMYVKTGLHVN